MPLTLILLFSPHVFAGGSGFNVVVVVNQNSTNSVQLGNYYCEKRQVPPQNLLRINWPGNVSIWTNTDFNAVLLNPLVSMLSSRQLTNQIDYVVLSMDIPYQLWDPAADINGTTAALFYGFKTNGAGINPASCTLPSGSSNSYAGSECTFRGIAPGSLAPTNLLAFMITSTNLDLAKMVVDQGTLGDYSFPTQTVFLSKTSDSARNVRYQTFDNAIFNTRLRGNYSMQRTNTFFPSYLGTSVLGYEGGVQSFSIVPTTFAPGAIADNLTSYGGLLFENSGHTPAWVFLSAGASGSYGTVVEPCAYLEKFPSPQAYFYQSRGFSLGECYYQSITNPYEGILLGEPLAAPFALPGAGAWNNLSYNALLTGTTNLSLQFLSPDANHPFAQVDLFVDGLFSQTLTNITPRTNNVISLSINGFPTNYTVPAGATIRSVASNLTSRLNGSSYTNSTKVHATWHGDRIELQSSDLSTPGTNIPVTAGSSIGSGTALTTYLSAIQPTFLDTVAYGIRGFTITGNPISGSFLQLVITTTNGTQVSLGVTNNSGLTLQQLTQELIDLVNTNSNPSLQGPDGLTAMDLILTQLSPLQQVQFNLQANSPGWAAAEIQADLNGSLLFTLSPSGAVKLEENINDLQPRNHLYVTAGVTNLPVTFAFNSANQPDGYHELTAVAYEGSHVRTQTRATQNVLIQNSSLSATFITLFGGSNTIVNATLQFSVVANTNNISKIELFSTGGSLTNVTSQSSAVFSVAGTNMGIGLHPFYAIVTGTNGKQYRTQTQWIRLVGSSSDSPFPLSFTNPPPTLTWPATVGKFYNIYSATNVANAFQIIGGFVASNSAAQWIDTNPGPPRYYRVQTTN